MLNTTKLPPPQPGRKFKDFVILFVFAGLITISFLALLWFLGIISSSLFFEAKDFSLEFVENVIHGGALLAVLIMFFAIGNCLVVLEGRKMNKKSSNNEKILNAFNNDLNDLVFFSFRYFLGRMSAKVSGYAEEKSSIELMRFDLDCPRCGNRKISEYYSLGIRTVG